MKNLSDPDVFSEVLFEKMKHISGALQDLELYEFRYALKNITPADGWESVQLDPKEEIEARVNSRAFYDAIQIKRRVINSILLDEEIVRLTNMLFVGCVNETYPEAWINEHFYFDVRGFFFLHRTTYFTASVLAHMGGKPFKQFEQKQKAFESVQDVGYKAFKEANAEVDRLFIECQPGHVQHAAKGSFDPSQRDVLRAARLRSEFAKMAAPDFTPTTK